MNENFPKQDNFVLQNFTSMIIKRDFMLWREIKMDLFSVSMTKDNVRLIN